MKKYRSVIILLAAILTLSAIPFLFSSCEKQKETGNLDYQTYPMSMYGKLIYDSNEYIVTVEIIDKENISVLFEAPSDMSGIKFILNNGEPEIIYQDIQIPIKSSDYIVSNGVLSLVKIFSLDKEHLSGIFLEEANGVIYNTSKYSYDGYEVTVYTLKGNSYPVMFKLSAGTHELEFTILPDKSQN